MQLRIAGIDFLVGNEGWDINEVARLGLGHELQPLTPAQASYTVDDVDDAFEVTMMMRPGLCLGLNSNGTRPELGGARGLRGHRGTTLHTRGLGRVGAQLARANDAYPV